MKALLMTGFAVLMLVSTQARAAGDSVYFELTGGPSYSLENISGSDMGTGGSFSNDLKSTEGVGVDGKGTVGYLIQGVALLGLTYNYSVLPAKREEVPTISDSLDRVTKRNEWGPTVGLFVGNFRLIFSALLSGSRTITHKSSLDGTTTGDFKLEDKLGSGYQFTLGYSLSVSRVLKIGPSLVYRRVNYQSQTLTNNLDPDPAANWTDRSYLTRPVEGSLTPMVSVMFVF